MYLGTSHGLYVFERGGYNLTLQKRYNDADGIATGPIRCLELDLTTDTLYLGTEFGLSAIDLRTEKVLEDYSDIFPTRFTDVEDILLYRVGSFRRLMVASGFGGFASIEVNNYPEFDEFIGSHLTDILSLIGVPFAIIGIFITTQKKFPKEYLYFYAVIFLLSVFSWWIYQLLQLSSIPYVKPDGV